MAIYILCAKELTRHYSLIPRADFATFSWFSKHDLSQKQSHFLPPLFFLYAPSFLTHYAQSAFVPLIVYVQFFGLHIDRANLFVFASQCAYVWQACIWGNDAHIVFMSYIYCAHKFICAPLPAHFPNFRSGFLQPIPPTIILPTLLCPLFVCMLSTLGRFLLNLRFPGTLHQYMFSLISTDWCSLSKCKNCSVKDRSRKVFLLLCTISMHAFSGKNANNQSSAYTYKWFA